MRIRTDLVLVAATAVVVAGVIVFVDLAPRVESEFFFSEDDPQLRATTELQERFPSPEQLVVRVPGDNLESAEYRATVRSLADSLRAVDGVVAAYSVATEDATSPLWGRLLTTPDGRATNIILQVDEKSTATLVAGVEHVISGVDRGAGARQIQVSGVLYVVELIRRSLSRDFVTFSLAALLVFGAMIAVVYRVGAVVLGTLTACLLSCAVTLIVNTLLGVRIGLLTANIVTIVFVLTLSHAVFLTANWRRALAEHLSPDAASAAVRMTFSASFWSMATTMLGFLALLLASARPLRELGIAGAIGAGVALAVAYGVFPLFLRSAGVGARTARGTRMPEILSRPPRRRIWLVLIAALVIAGVPGVFRLATEPSLLSYFAPGSDLRAGLEAIDRDGGSSTLYLAVRDTAGARIDTDAIYERMWDLQEELESDSAVGVVLSPAPMLSHAKRQPLAGLLGWSQLLDILDTPLFNHISRSFVSADRSEALYFLRMRESGVFEGRAATTERMRAVARGHGFEVAQTGGVFELQAQLGRLISRSVRYGLGGLVVLFVGIAFIVARRGSWAAAMVAGLAGIPVVVLGAMGHLGLPLDIITSPAANISLAMGVDSMIHLVTRVRRLRGEGLSDSRAWRDARSQLLPAILGATLIICAGFGIFALSQFPPTQRFGIAVIIGTVTAATMTLVALPLMTERREVTVP